MSFQDDATYLRELNIFEKIRTNSIFKNLKKIVHQFFPRNYIVWQNFNFSRRVEFFDRSKRGGGGMPHVEEMGARWSPGAERTETGRKSRPIDGAVFEIEK